MNLATAIFIREMEIAFFIIYYYFYILYQTTHISEKLRQYVDIHCKKIRPKEMKYYKLQRHYERKVHLTFFMCILLIRILILILILWNEIPFMYYTNHTIMTFHSSVYQTVSVRIHGHKCRCISHFKDKFNCYQSTESFHLVALKQGDVLFSVQFIFVFDLIIVAATKINGITCIRCWIKLRTTA